VRCGRKKKIFFLPNINIVKAAELSLEGKEEVIHDS